MSYKTVKVEGIFGSAIRTVFENGKTMKDYTMDEICSNAVEGA